MKRLTMDDYSITERLAVESYLSTILWCGLEEDEDIDDDDNAKPSLMNIDPQCFMAQAFIVTELWDIYRQLGWVQDTHKQAYDFGYDLYLSRIGAGTGFWDDYGDKKWHGHGDDIHKDVIALREPLVYRGDDGEIRIEEDDWGNTRVSILYLKEKYNA